MALLKDDAVVIKSTNFSEADKILTLYGKGRGKFSVIAKGARKIESRNRGNIQTLNICKIAFFEGQNLGILRESEALYIPDYAHLEIDSIKRVLSVLNKLIHEDEPDSGIFDKLSTLIKEGFGQVATDRFRIYCLRQLGHLVDYDFCTSCSKSLTGNGNDGERVYGFELKELGALCESCFKNAEGEVVAVEKIKSGSQKFTQAIDRYVKEVMENT